MRLPLILLITGALVRAQVPNIPGVNLDILNNPAMLEAAQKCGEYFDQNSAGQEACASASEAAVAAGTWKCPEACKSFWAGLPDACDALLSAVLGGSLGDLKDAAGNSVSTRDWYTQLCSGEPVSVPSTPSGDNTTADGPGVSINYTGFASTFECDTAGGFSWLTLDPSLATLTGGGSAAAALNSTCNDRAAAGCCVQAAASSLTVAQFGLGCVGPTVGDPLGPHHPPLLRSSEQKPMVVQGVKLTAPSGDCCLGGGGGGSANCTDGSGPCSERFINTYVSVSNSSVEQVLAGPEYKQWKEAVAMANLTGDQLLLAGQTWLWGSLLAGPSATAGLCNIVTEYDVYGVDGTDGEMLNNGTAAIGCGLGIFGGKANVTMAGQLAGNLGIGLSPNQNATASIGLAREKPAGSWLLLSRFSQVEPLVFCGLQVCAKPAEAAS